VSAVLKLMTFRLYDTPTGGRALWEETQSPVTVANGVFNVVLGSVTPIILPFDAQYYLGVQANDDGEMKPRQALATSPYAFRAGSLDPSATIAGSQITGAIAGATMPGVAPWVAIGGTSQLAVSNTAYMVTGATPATITMPAAPAVGDVVKVSSQGLGGWTLVPNTGQAIEGANVPRGVTWTPRESARFWWSVASSADGAKLAAVVDGGQIYTSTDSGVTWTPRDAVRPWRSVASSADGTKLVAVVQGGQIYTSTDSGVTWTARESARSWRSVASSTDGTKLAAVAFTGLIYNSTDSGATWTPRESARQWISVASSADGAKLVAVEAGGRIYTSTDSGATWTPRESARNWVSVASSADGAKLVAVEYGGQIYTSADSGATWTPRESARFWWSVASSADGAKLAAVVYGGQIYTSTDSGASWTPRESARQWVSVASSADGAKLAAVVQGGQIYTSGITTLTGGLHSSAELVYAGNGQWIVVSQQGSLTTP
jgi:hypothetical protein